jgi:hypothetical protein
MKTLEGCWIRLSSDGLFQSTINLNRDSRGPTLILK